MRCIDHDCLSTSYSFANNFDDLVGLFSGVTVPCNVEYDLAF